MPISLDLPLPPTVNHHYYHRKNQKILTNEGRKFRAQVAGIVYSQYRGPVLTGRLSVHMELYAPDRRRYDVDNRIKPMLDALEKSEKLFLNDSQVDELYVLRGAPVGGSGYCRVVIRELEDGDVSDRV